MKTPNHLMLTLLLAATWAATGRGAIPTSAQSALSSENSGLAEPSALAQNAPNGNPLWAIPLASLTITRERPLFSQTRRAPDVATGAVANPVVRTPPKVREPERAPLALVGTIIGAKDVFGVFIDDAAKTVVRLRPGDIYQGWVLRTVRGRQATLEKEEQATTLSLPQPSEELAKGITRRAR